MRRLQQAAIGFTWTTSHTLPPSTPRHAGSARPSRAYADSHLGKSDLDLSTPTQLRHHRSGISKRRSRSLASGGGEADLVTGCHSLLGTASVGNARGQRWLAAGDRPVARLRQFGGGCRAISVTSTSTGASRMLATTMARLCGDTHAAGSYGRPRSVRTLRSSSVATPPG